MNCHCGVDIAEHKAGRELDFCTSVKTGYFTPHGENYSHSSGYGVVIRSKEEWLELDRHPHFSTSIAPAWELVDEMPRGLGFYQKKRKGDWVVYCGIGVLAIRVTIMEALSIAYLAYTVKGGE